MFHVEHLECKIGGCVSFEEARAFDVFVVTERYDVVLIGMEVVQNAVADVERAECGEVGYFPIRPKCKKIAALYLLPYVRNGERFAIGLEGKMCAYVCREPFVGAWVFAVCTNLDGLMVLFGKCVGEVVAKYFHRNFESLAFGLVVNFGNGNINGVCGCGVEYCPTPKKE